MKGAEGVGDEKSDQSASAAHVEDLLSTFTFHLPCRHFCEGEAAGVGTAVAEAARVGGER